MAQLFILVVLNRQQVMRPGVLAVYDDHHQKGDATLLSKAFL